MSREETKYAQALKIKKGQQAAFRRFIRGQSTPINIRDWIGLNWQETKLLLENRMIPTMNWNNYGNHWVVDHIVPFWVFDVTNEADMKLLWHYDNLMPLRWRDNLLKQGDLHFSISLLSCKKGFSLTVERLIERAQNVLKGQDEYRQLYKNFY